VEGTLAKHILSEPEEITTMNGQKLPLKMQVRHFLVTSNGYQIVKSYKFGPEWNFRLSKCLALVHYSLAVTVNGN